MLNNEHLSAGAFMCSRRDSLEVSNPWPTEAAQGRNLWGFVPARSSSQSANRLSKPPPRPTDGSAVDHVGANGELTNPDLLIYANLLHCVTVASRRVLLLGVIITVCGRLVTLRWEI